MNNFFDAVQARTERYLTKRKAEAQYKKEHKTFLGEVLSWIDALLFAVVVVLLINQFLFQFFVIPSPSMVSTLLVGDRVWVSKTTYGIELYPQGPKILDSRIPDRDDVITFYNPQYESKGPFFNTVSTMIYMATFSLVNIDVDEEGNMREKLLVKRSAAAAGDTVTFRDGNAYVKLSGTGEYVPELEYRQDNGYSTAMHRTIKDSTYVGYNALGRLNGMYEDGVAQSSLPKHLMTDADKINSNESYTDQYGYDKNFAIGRMCADPTDFQARSDWAKLDIGVYVPEGCVLPLGDNRDNSLDGRYFGPIEGDNINGFVRFRIWPMNRLGSLDRSL